MNFKELNIKACYESGIDDIIEDFYMPVLGASIRYDRIAGFFSSASMAVAARGLSDFIKNGGKMRLITSPRLNQEDLDVIKKIADNDSDISLKDFGIDVNNLVNEFEINHVKALGWMLKEGLLEMKLAIVLDEHGTPCDKETCAEKGLFHQKVGILHDTEGNELSFSGSINETAAAWVNNDEEFKVFKGWTEAQPYFIRDKERFSEIWNGNRENVKVYNLPDALKEDIVHYSSDFKYESISLKKYHASKVKNYDFKDDSSLFFYQAEALNKWKDVGYKMLFEMATGTGKTRTAIAGINYLNKTNKSLITIISTPQNTLSKQWKNEVESMGIKVDESVIIDGSVNKWEQILKRIIYKNSAGLADHCIIYTTHSTASSIKFTSAFENDRQNGTELLFVGDETHWLGAKKLQNALLEIYKYRIGLSATPSRWFDDFGTQKLVNYYGNESFEFTIKDALTKFNPITGKHFLVNYNYHIHKVELNEEETINYKKFTKSISSLMNKVEQDDNTKEKLDRLREQRANIIKNAYSKYDELKQILNEIESKGRIENLLIFVSPLQLQSVMDILNSHGIISHKLTEKEGTRPEERYNNLSEREVIIRKFKEGTYQAIVAIKCMDEGIDIPTADTGILMASSSNPREYIQRIGRIIRQAPGKGIANLYDLCVDTISNEDEVTVKIERQIREKEQTRLKEIASNAINSIEALGIIKTLS